MRHTLPVIPAIFALLLSGCVNVAKINSNFRRVDQAWALEYQKTEDEYRYRVIDADLLTTYTSVKRTFLNLGMPISEESLQSGTIIAVAEAPVPLTKDEWIRVAAVESPKMKKIAGWMFYLPDNPKGYFVTVRASLAELNGRTIVVLNYSLDHPEYRAMGFLPSEYAPPLSVQLGSLKFWGTLRQNLSEKHIAAPRQRRPDEPKAKFAEF